MTGEYPDYWPVAMRSSRHSKHLEWKRDQEQLERQYKNKPPEERPKSSKSYTVPKTSTYNNKSTAEIVSSNKPVQPSIRQDTVAAIRHRYKDKIIVWIRAKETIDDEAFCLYVLEYKGHTRLERGKRRHFLSNAILSAVSCALDNIKKPGYELVFLCPYYFTEHEKGFADHDDIKAIIKQKHLKVDFVCCERNKKLIESYVDSVFAKESE